jgi:argininosuccinate lyase
LRAVETEISAGTFAAWARASGCEDVHGAIDLRVRELAPETDGGALHAGRSRNDQVATTLLLYARDRAERGAAQCAGIARFALDSAQAALEERTLLAATTHQQPAQPILLAFWLGAVAEMFARGAHRFARVAADARAFSPLGSGACSGSTLPLDRAAAARELGFAAPSRNALDAAGDRDVALDLLHAVTRALTAASRVAAEIVQWCTPAFGYVRLDDAASAGSSLMPQKRNPDAFEHVRAHAALRVGDLAGALGACGGLPLSYHGDLQEVKAAVLRGTDRGLAALEALERALRYVRWNAAALNARAGDGYTVATDVADALIARGVAARAAHAEVGAAVARAEAAGRPLEARDLATLGVPSAPLDAAASVSAKRTAGSTQPREVEVALRSLEAELDAAFGAAGA